MMVIYTLLAMAVSTVIAIQAVKQIRLFLIKLYEHTNGEKLDDNFDSDDEPESFYKPWI